MIAILSILFSKTCRHNSRFFCSQDLLTAFSASTCAFLFSVEVSVEKKLIRDLLITYEEVTPHGRPVINDSSTVNVQFGLGLIQMELDEKEKALALSLWTKYVNKPS